MRLLDEGSWADWAQVVAALFALAIPALPTLWAVLRSPIKAICTPLAGERHRSARRWEVELFNRSTRVQSFDIVILAATAGSLATVGRPKTRADGGTVTTDIRVVDRAFEMHVVRLAPKRALVLDLSFSRPSVPILHSDSKRISRTIVSGKRGLWRSDEAFLVVGKLRSRILVGQFCLGFLMIMIRLLSMA